MTASSWNVLATWHLVSFGHLIWLWKSRCRHFHLSVWPRLAMDPSFHTVPLLLGFIHISIWGAFTSMNWNPSWSTNPTYVGCWARFKNWQHTIMLSMTQMDHGFITPLCAIVVVNHTHVLGSIGSNGLGFIVVVVVQSTIIWAIFCSKLSELLTHHSTH